MDRTSGKMTSKAESDYTRPLSVLFFSFLFIGADHAIMFVYASLLFFPPFRTVRPYQHCVKKQQIAAKIAGELGN